MDYQTFNILEAVFWIALGLAGYACRSVRGGAYRGIALYAAAVFIAFGISDATEIRYGSFLDSERAWLLTWKIVNAAAIACGFGWYIFARLRDRRHEKP